MKYAKQWLGEALKINGKIVGVNEAARRACNYLATHHEESVMQSLLEKNYPVVKYMNEKKIEAMVKETRLNISNQEILMKHLRSHFGPKAFASRQKQREWQLRKSDDEKQRELGQRNSKSGEEKQQELQERNSDEDDQDCEVNN
jgi:hypothetical protein